ncbi:MAG TPA: adenylate/guanylate cyclase domain-containing protein, partial [bacterium]|nr:adenylate/guanylate cyclase domain-containing protein [bacterium]
RYVTKQVADEIIRNPNAVSLGGKKQMVTVLFSDIRGFTVFSEKYAPEEVVARLNEYLSAMVDVIFENEGTLDKFIGDAVMAVFGSPIAHDDDPLRAVKTALDMQRRLNGLNEKWTSEGREPLVIGIGINTGEVIAGNIGDMRRMEYTVIGDNVNLASHIEGLTKNFNCPILMSASTYELVKDKVVAKNLGSVSMKGKLREVEIYELLS